MTLREYALRSVDCPLGDPSPVISLRVHLGISLLEATQIFQVLIREGLLYQSQAGISYITARGRYEVNNGKN